MASGGYPVAYETGYEIEGLQEDLPGTFVFHAGTRREDGRVLTDGGRVLGVTAWDDDLRSAMDSAYARADRIHWPDAMMRHDIGAKGLREE
jgi:phosphoribosylamine--glycine ligase